MPSRKGSPNKRSNEFDALYDRYTKHYGDPVEAMFAMSFDDEVEPAIRAKVLSELAKLKHPTKRAIDVQGEITQEVLVHLDPGAPRVEQAANGGRTVGPRASRARARVESAPALPPVLS